MRAYLPAQCQHLAADFSRFGNQVLSVEPALRTGWSWLENQA